MALIQTPLKHIVGTFIVNTQVSPITVTTYQTQTADLPRGNIYLLLSYIVQNNKAIYSFEIKNLITEQDQPVFELGNGKRIFNIFLLPNGTEYILRFAIADNGNGQNTIFRRYDHNISSTAFPQILEDDLNHILNLHYLEIEALPVW